MMNFVSQTLKRIAGTLGLHLMTLRTWHELHRTVFLTESIRERPIDLFDVLVDSCFAGRKPFVLQVGANDGVTDDVLCRYVRERQWPGILVEPQPHTFRRLTENYPAGTNLILENVAISQSSESLTLYRLRPTDDKDRHLDVYTSCDRQRLERAKQRCGTPCEIDELTVPATTVDALLRKHKVRQLDILYIDTEGMDAEVLSTANLAVWLPTLIYFEHLHLSIAQLSACFELLDRHGYRLADVGRNVVAYRPGGHGC